MNDHETNEDKTPETIFSKRDKASSTSKKVSAH